MIQIEDLTLEEVCNICLDHIGFQSFDDATRYIMKRDGVLGEYPKPEKYAKYLSFVYDVCEIVPKEKPETIYLKGEEHKVDYNIIYQSWWPHAIYQNTISKIKQTPNINHISLSLACFMSHKIKKSIEIEDIIELELELLEEKNGMVLYKAGFFLTEKPKIFKKILYKVLRR